MINIKTFNVLYHYVKKEVKTVNFFTEERKTMFNMRTVINNNDQRQTENQGKNQPGMTFNNNNKRGRKMFRMF